LSVLYVTQLLFHYGNCTQSSLSKE